MGLWKSIEEFGRGQWIGEVREVVCSVRQSFIHLVTEADMVKF